MSTAQKDKKNMNDLPDTPYLAARREWNERYASFVATANNWRILALSSVAVSLVLAVGLVIVSGQQKIVPYVVETNTFGEVSHVSRADIASKPNEKEMKAALRQWVIGARTVYVDMRAEKDIIDQTYAMTLPDSAAYKTLAAFHRGNDPYQRSAKETVEVTVNAVIPVSDTTLQVEWTEITKQRSGKQVGEPKHWQGDFTVVIAPPNDPEQIMVNPLGIYVSQLAWTPRI